MPDPTTITTLTPALGLTYNLIADGYSMNEIAAQRKVSKSAVQDTYRRLARLGLIVRDPNHPRQYRAVEVPDGSTPAHELK